MADLTVIALKNRVHAINGTITLADSSTLTAFRYWPQIFENPSIPAIVPMLGPISYTVSSKKGPIRGIRQIKLLVPVDSPNAGILTESAQRNTEAVIDPIIRAYRLAPYLELNDEALDGITDVVSLTQDTGIVLSPSTGLLQVEFTLAIPVIMYQSS